VKNDFFTKNRVKTALRAGLVIYFFTKNRVRNALWVGSQFLNAEHRRSHQTFVKSLRVRNALRAGLVIYFFVNENGA